MPEISGADALFASHVKKVVNSKIICDNREELLQQMQSIANTYHIEKINVLEVIEDQDGMRIAFRWEISYGDQTTESVITFLTCDNQGLIKEINEVFGEKAIYEWKS